MQLPRGRFEQFVRDAKIKEILNELQERKFTGCLSGILGESEGELIFEGGEIILAQSLKYSGSDVFSELFSNQDGKVTAELSQYSEPQVKLAKEFNQKFSVKPGSFASAFSSFLKQNPAEKREEPKKAEVPLKRDNAKETLKSDKTACAGAAVSEKNSSADVKRDEESILSINESEIEAIKKNFSSGAADLLKRIHMDHLIPDENKGGKNK